MTKRKLLSKAPKEYHKILSDVYDTLKANKIKITISEDKYVQYLGNCLGFFGGEVGAIEFAVAVGNPIEIWMPTFIHESCHLDQFLEDKYIWDTSDIYIDYYFRWVSGEIELSPTRVRESMEKTILLEKDCEERSVAKIKKYNLPMDTDRYIQTANTYLYSYTIFTEKRKFIEGIHSNPMVYGKCPKHFVSNYTKLPIKIRSAIEKHIASIENNKI